LSSSSAVANPAAAAVAPSASINLSRWQRAWEGWKRIAHAIGVFQTRLVMLVFFFVFVLPLGLILRVVRDPLHLKHPPRTNWVDHRRDPHDLDHARQQF
jgi:hypothetical protein